MKKMENTNNLTLETNEHVQKETNNLTLETKEHVPKETNGPSFQQVYNDLRTKRLIHITVMDVDNRLNLDLGVKNRIGYSISLQQGYKLLSALASSQKTKIRQTKNLALLAAGCAELDKCNRRFEKPKKPNFFMSIIARIKKAFH